MKRILDIIVSGILLLILLVPGIFVMLLLRFTGEGNVIYAQARVGLGGKFFEVYKLVTMRVGSEAIGNQEITIRNDPRVLPVGRVLRKTKLNELPQLFNVFSGDMSLVGWRPLVEKSFSYYPKHVRDKIVEVRPGLTGMGSMFFRDEEALVEKTTKGIRQLYIEDIAPYKGELELWYNNHRTFWLDLKILFCTAWVVVFPNSKLYQKMFLGIPHPPSGGEISRLRGSSLTCA